jgi:peptidoglycan hydrolase-like protein with peptidoglycan-binding domain
VTTFAADVLPRHRANVGFVEGANNANPWGPRQGIPNAAYCFSAQSIVNVDAGVSWWPESQCGRLGFAYCPSGVNVGQARGVVRFDHASRGDPADLIPGDLVFYSWNGTSVADHVEVVIQVYADGTFDTIGYNTGSPNGCHVVRRDRRYLLCRLRMQPFYDGSAAPGPAPAPPPAPTPVGPRNLAQGTRGDDVRQWQVALNHFGYGLAEDGDFGPRTAAATRDFQSRHGAVADGVVGPQTRAAMSAALSTPPTPAPAPAPPPPAPAPPPPPAHGPDGNPFTPLAVDGGMGPLTTRALQWKLGVAQDGQIGPVTVRALQQRVGSGVDGAMGPDTIRHLQARVGAGVDGQWGPDTTRHLQAALNAGTF